MSIVEEMSAGLIPRVPSIWGQTEFGPISYQFNTLNEAAKMIAKYISAPNSTRFRISNSMNQFLQE